MVVFPVGMYATLGMRLGTAAGPPVIHRIGTAAAWLRRGRLGAGVRCHDRFAFIRPAPEHDPDIREFYIVVR